MARGTQKGRVFYACAIAESDSNPHGLGCKSWTLDKNGSVLRHTWLNVFKNHWDLCAGMSSYQASLALVIGLCEGLGAKD